MSVRYRIGQFLRAIIARVDAEELDFARRWLTPAAWKLYASLPRQDQRHSLDLAYGLMAGGRDDPDLLAAALLHDAGKAAAGLSVLHRSAAVLLQAWGGNWLVQLNPEACRDWIKPFWVHYHHAELGAQRAEEAGCSETTVWLIRNHHRFPGQFSESTEHRKRLLAELQQHDSVH